MGRAWNSLNGDQGRDVLRGGADDDFLADYDDGDLMLGGKGNDRAAILSEDPGTSALTRLHLGPATTGSSSTTTSSPTSSTAAPATTLPSG